MILTYSFCIIRFVIEDTIIEANDEIVDNMIWMILILFIVYSDYCCLKWEAAAVRTWPKPSSGKNGSKYKTQGKLSSGKTKDSPKKD